MPWQQGCQMPWSTRLKTSTCQKLRLVPTAEHPFLVASSPLALNSDDADILNADIPSGHTQRQVWGKCQNRAQSAILWSLFENTETVSRSANCINMANQVLNPSHPLWVQLPLSVLSTKQKRIGLNLIMCQGGDKAVWLKGAFLYILLFSIRKLSCSRTSVLSSHKRYSEVFEITQSDWQ